MAHLQQQGIAGPQQQAGAAPEDIWTPFIQEQYPDLLSQTYCLPPIFFYPTPQAVETVARQTVLVRDNPRSRGTGKQQPAPPPAQVAGSVFVENPPDSQDVCTLVKDWQGDTAHDRCLQALSKIQNEVMFIISNLHFRKYLHNPTTPLHAAAIAQLPSIDDLSSKIKDGECDVIVIHRTYGLLIGEIKSVGDSDFRTYTPCELTKAITSRITRAVEQLDNQREGLKHLVGDLPPIRITMTLLLPNISSSQLQSALSASPSLLQALCETLSLPTDVRRAVRQCLCQEDRGQPLTWWNNLHTAGPDQSMDDHLYQRLVARFCGPATTVDIPTAGHPRGYPHKVQRSFGEAVAETGLRFSSLMLTRDQVDLLNPLHEPQFMHLQGPPGTGKTVVLFLKALQWVHQDRQVVLVSGVDRSLAVTRLVEVQLHRSMGPAVFDPANIQRLSYDFTGCGFDAGSALAWLQRHIRPGPVLVIFDEVDDIRHNYGYWLREVRAHLPAVSVWGAGVLIWESSDSDPLTVPPPDPLPPWVEVQTLQEPLRCPPSVTAHLQQACEILINGNLQYRDPRVPVPTRGPNVRQRKHYNQTGHSDSPQRCDMCSDDVVEIITRELHAGQPGQPLQYRDILILIVGDYPRADDVMPQRLRDHRVPVRVVTTYPLGPDDIEELALATTDQVMITHHNHATGLERRVVIVLAPRQRGMPPLLAQSRCSGYLYVIDLTW